MPIEKNRRFTKTVPPSMSAVFLPALETVLTCCGYRWFLESLCARYSSQVEAEGGGKCRYCCADIKLHDAFLVPA